MPGLDILTTQYMTRSGPKVIKPFSNSTQLSKKIIMLINVKLPTIVGILTLMSMMINASSGLESKKSL